MVHVQLHHARGKPDEREPQNPKEAQERLPEAGQSTLMLARYISECMCNNQ